MWQCSGEPCIYNSRWANVYDDIVLLKIAEAYEPFGSFRWKTLPHSHSEAGQAIVCDIHTRHPDIVQQALLDRLRYEFKDSATL